MVLLFWNGVRVYLGRALGRLREEAGEGPASYLGTMIVVFVVLLALAGAFSKECINWSAAAQALADKLGEAIENLKFSD